MDMSRDMRTLWCGNLSNRVTEDILYELFLQAGPLEEVKIPRDRDSRPRAYGFVTYKHDESVDYALELYKGYPIPYASQDQMGYRGPVNMHPSNHRRNSSRNHPYHRR
ncbi:splicing regulator RBM11 isoform X2 [Venturia canescens]|uniref:splicing regulator RBM11 isoform X2 n=1 Tax=Venturia canescens TaxID=32260 RepID=UPI001C9CB710|nr:splicing regulator RBM11 isoform X2 [Venturia canescens]